MIHYWNSPASVQLAPHGNRCTNRTSSVSGCRLYVKLLEWRTAIYLAVGYRIHGAATGKRQRIQPVALVQCVDKMKERFLVHDLDRPRDIAMSLRQLTFASRWA